MKTSFRCLLSFLTIYFALNPARASAVPSEATLFPDSARIVDISRVQLLPSSGETFKTIITLPGQTVPDSLSVSLPSGSGLRIVDQSWRQINRQDDARITDLRRQIQNLKTEKIGIVAGIQALDAQIQFWQAQAKARAKSVEEANTLSVLIAKSVKKAFQEKLTLEPDLQKNDNRIKELQEELNRITGHKESLWEVTILIGGQAVRETTITLAYSLAGCGWAPLYRLDARPRDGSIFFAWDAEIWQSSGIDWKQVQTKLATLAPRSAISPPVLTPWIIQPHPAHPIPIRPRVKADLPLTPEVISSEVRQMEPHEIRMSTYSIWDLGKRNIAAGARQRIKVREEIWPALFTHLLRPSLTSQAFINASVTLPEGKEIPIGQASILIDGALLTRRPFSFAGTDGTFSFGVDPLVTAEAILVARKAGEKGFLADKQTHEWVLKFELRNDRDSPVQIRMEDPLLQTRDERIRLSSQFEPEPSQKTTDSLIWLMEIPAGQKKFLSGMIRIEAPKDMDLDLGWRR